jgi:hypothetical protein
VVFIILNHGHLYNTSLYAPASTHREYESSLPRHNNDSLIGVPTQEANKSYGKVRLPGNQNSGGQSSMNNLVNNKLTNRDVYNKMKSKAIYGNSSKISMHAKLNSL